MSGWAAALVMAALAIAAGLPAVLRAVSLARRTPYRVETYGAANDPRH